MSNLTSVHVTAGVPDVGTGTVSTIDNLVNLPLTIGTMPTTAVTGTFFQATQPVSIATMPTTPVTGTFFQTTQPVSIAGTVATSAATSTTSTVTSTSFSSLNNTSATLTGGVSNVLGLAVFNNTNAPLYVLCKGSGTASATNFTVLMQPGAYYECPFTFIGQLFGFQVSSAASSGAVLVTQYTA
jgi:hypothetical protein